MRICLGLGPSPTPCPSTDTMMEVITTAFTFRKCFIFSLIYSFWELQGTAVRNEDNPRSSLVLQRASLTMCSGHPVNYRSVARDIIALFGSCRVPASLVRELQCPQLPMALKLRRG